MDQRALAGLGMRAQQGRGADAGARSGAPSFGDSPEGPLK
jgi:hypothetical protein